MTPTIDVECLERRPRQLKPSAEPASQQQQSFHQFMTELGQLRQSRPALRNGQRTSLYVDDDVMIFARHHGSDWMVVALNQGGRCIQNVDLHHG